MCCCDTLVDSMTIDEKITIMFDYQRYIAAGKLEGLLRFVVEEHFPEDVRSFKLTSLVFAVSNSLAWERIAMYNACVEST